MLNICVLGKGLLAETTVDCCKRHFNVTWNTRMSEPPLDLVWACYDTPLSDQGADYDWVIKRIRGFILLETKPIPMLISSQLPVGTVAQLEREFPAWSFAYSPENIRVATPVSDFMRQDRIVVGRRVEFPHHDKLWYDLTRPFTDYLILTDPETAEMVKHALNAYLGMNIAFINEIERIARVVGANMDDLERALLSEHRISPDAPLHAGPTFEKGHLARELQLLTYLSREHGLRTPLLDSILPSNTP